MTCYFCSDDITKAIGSAEICDECFSDHTGHNVEDLPEDMDALVPSLSDFAYKRWVKETLSLFDAKTTAKKSTRPAFDAMKNLHPTPAAATAAYYYSNPDPFATVGYAARSIPSAGPLGAACPLPLPEGKVEKMIMKFPARCGLPMATIKDAWESSIGEFLPEETIKVFEETGNSKLLGPLNKGPTPISEALAARMAKVCDNLASSISSYGYEAGSEIVTTDGENVVTLLRNKTYYHAKNNMDEASTALILLLSLPKVRDHSSLLEVTYKVKASTKRVSARSRKKEF